MCFLQWYVINFYCCEVWSSPGLCSWPFALLFIYIGQKIQSYENIPLLYRRHSAVCAHKSWWWISNHEIRDLLMCSEEMDVWWAVGALHGRLCHQRMNVCRDMRMIIEGQGFKVRKGQDFLSLSSVRDRAELQQTEKRFNTLTTPYYVRNAYRR